MGLMSWMIKKVGDTPRKIGSVACFYIYTDKQTHYSNELDKLFMTIGLRYSSLGAVVFPSVLLGYMHQKIANREKFGLAELCSAIISYDDGLSLTRVGSGLKRAAEDILLEMGRFTREQVFGQRYSIEDFDAACQRWEQDAQKKAIEQGLVFLSKMLRDLNIA